MEIRRATPADGPGFIALVLALADMEKLEPPTQEAQQRLLEHAFGQSPPFQLWVADGDGAVVAYAVTFLTYSTFRAMPTLYLEDLFVSPAARRPGIATAILNRLRDHGRDLGCARFEWIVLDWNQDARALYEKFGATVFEEFRLCRVNL